MSFLSNDGICYSIFFVLLVFRPGKTSSFFPFTFLSFLKIYLHLWFYFENFYVNPSYMLQMVSNIL